MRYFYSFFVVVFFVVQSVYGQIDPTFTSGTGFNNSVVTLAMQTDSKIIVGGSFISYNGVARRRIARLNSDGSLDIAFTQTGTGLNAGVRVVAIQSDDKVLVGGDFNSYNGTTRNFIARLNADGSLDGTFAATGTGLNSTVYDIVVQSDGKIIVGGAFTDYNGTTMNRIARLNSDGSLDGTFLPTGTGLNDEVYAIAVQGSGNILVGGIFTSYNGTARSRLALLNSDGTLNAFNQTGTGLDDGVLSLFVQSDNKMLVGGFFTAYNGIARSRVARLNSDGTLDATFSQLGTGFNDHIRRRCISVQADGKIIVAGSFTDVNGVLRNRIARLNADGSVDATFIQTGTGLNSDAAVLAVQGSDKIIVGGIFTDYNGTVQNRITRLLLSQPVVTPPPPPPVLTAPTISGGTFSGSVGIPFGAALNASGNPAPGVSVSEGALPPGITLTGGNLSGIPAQEGTYTFTITATNSQGTATANITINVGPAVPLVTGVSPQSGMYGSSVTISGYNLTGANAVSIGGIGAQSFSFVDGSLVAVVGAGGTGAVSVSTPLGSSSGGSFTFVLPEPPVLSNSPMAKIQTGDENFSFFLAGRNIPSFASVSMTPVSSTGAVLGISLPIQIISVSETGATLLAPVSARLAGTKRLTLRVADITSVSTTFAIALASPPMAKEITVSSTTASGSAFTTVVSGTGFFRFGFARVFVNGEENFYSSIIDANTANIQIPAEFNVRGGTVRIRIQNLDGQSTETMVRVIGRSAPFITGITPRWVNGTLHFVVRGVAFSPRITAVLGRRQVTVLPGGTDTEFVVAIPSDYPAPTQGTALLMVENPDGQRYGVLISASSFVPPTNSTLAESKNNTLLASSMESRLQINTSNHAMYEEFHLTPNPASEVLTLETPAFTGVGRVQIVNMRGEEIVSGEIAGEIAHGTRQTLDIRALPSGIYVVRFTAGRVQAMQRVRVVR